MKVLVINAGSSSIKYQLYGMPGAEVLAKGLVERIGEPTSRLVHSRGDDSAILEEAVANHEAAMELILRVLVQPGGTIEDLSEIEAVGHRVVHGGEEFTGSVIIDDRVLASIERFAELAPLHNPHNLVGIRAAMRKLPGTAQVACFDTAFHTSIPKVAHMYALPYELYERHRVRRYGFHGTSHRYVARRAAAMLGRDKYDLNAITCHLGNGCSIAAVRKGRSVDTSMGFTP
ncbi:MAG TPA: acetate/propionate family kinase, partial [Sedimentisphaerales bacterium]|nr:acetate/propionate family kinase [Sedimentisphaerales bacterium]